MPTDSALLICLAREYRGFSQARLARELGVSQGTLSRVENRISNPSDEMLANISDKLNFPISYFNQVVDFRNLPLTFFRRRYSLSQKSLKAITAQTNFARMHVKRLLKAFEYDEPLINAINADEYCGAIEQLARDVRVLMDIRNGPIDDLTAAVERAGILVIKCDFGTDKVDGICLTGDDIPPLILLNKQLPGDRWRFTLAHELGHLLLHNNLTMPNQTMKSEDEAHRFAAELLMPAPDIRGQLTNKFDLKKAATLKTYWKVSMQALIARAHELGKISEHKKRRLQTQLSSMGYRREEPNKIVQEQPTALSSLFEHYTKGMGYDFAEICELISISEVDFPILYPDVVRPKPQLRLFDKEALG